VNFKILDQFSLSFFRNMWI